MIDHTRRVLIGEPVRRKEDRRLLTGNGRYSDDVSLPGQAYAVLLRSPHAHARIRSIDAARAKNAPCVLAILSASDALADGLNPIPHTPVGFSAIAKAVGRDGVKFQTPHFPLAIDKVRFVGEAIAVIVAETIAAAEEAADQIEIEYEILPSVTNTAAAGRPDAPLVWDGTSNICTAGDVGNFEATRAAFERAIHIARISTWVQRVTAVPMECRAVVAAYDPVTGRYDVHAGSGGSVRLKNDVAGVLGIDESMVRVVAQDVGGNFGSRNTTYPEFALVAWAARRVGRPIKWTCTRHEAFLSDFQGRDLVVEAELALDEDGNFLAVRGTNTSNVGAYAASLVPLTKGLEIMTGVYCVPVAHIHGRGVCSNTASTSPYRSAGRPEAIYVIERLIDIAARQFGFDPVALRRKNLIKGPPTPFSNPVGVIYDGGAYETVMDRALALGDWDGFPDRKAEAALRGKCRGIGVANYIEVTHGEPRERAEVTVTPDGFVDVVIGTLSSGQGHETSFAQLLSEWFGVPIDRINLITGDTARVSVGGGSHSSRSMRFASIVIGNAVREILDKATRLVALMLDVSAAEIEFADGLFHHRATDRRWHIFEVAKEALVRNDLPDDQRGPLAAVSDETIRVSGFPYGCHVCEVEIDPEIGGLEIIRYVTVDDVGRAVNPMILHGQAHGGIAQGIGQALMEHCHYDPESGELLSASLMDHAIPRASALPYYTTEISEVPSPTNPLGIRAGGEGGTTGALAAVGNAVADALAEFGVFHIDMPITAERIWRAIRPQ